MPISFFGKRFFRAYIRARIARVRTGRTPMPSENRKTDTL